MAVVMVIITEEMQIWCQERAGGQDGQAVHCINLGMLFPEGRER
jgi:hypothetical protein